MFRFAENRWNDNFEDEFVLYDSDGQFIMIKKIKSEVLKYFRKIDKSALFDEKMGTNCIFDKKNNILGYCRRNRIKVRELTKEEIRAIHSPALLL